MIMQSVKRTAEISSCNKANGATRESLGQRPQVMSAETNIKL